MMTEDQARAHVAIVVEQIKTEAQTTRDLCEIVQQALRDAYQRGLDDLTEQLLKEVNEE